MGYMSYDELYKEECPEGRCKRCEYAEVVTAQDQWQFLGCYHEPYHGTWVAEIKDCPKNYSKVTINNPTYNVLANTIIH